MDGLEEEEQPEPQLSASSSQYDGAVAGATPVYVAAFLTTLGGQLHLYVGRTSEGPVF